MPPLSTKMLSHEAAVRAFLRLVDVTDGCWLWKGNRIKNGYGRVKIGGHAMYTHRRAHELFIGPVPAGALVLHSCDVKHCVNPAHLRAGTYADNGADMRSRGRSRNQKKTHCAKGHPFDATHMGTYVHRGRAYRKCRTCINAAARHVYAQKGGTRAVA